VTRQYEFFSASSEELRAAGQNGRYSHDRGVGSNTFGECGGTLGDHDFGKALSLADLDVMAASHPICPATVKIDKIGRRPGRPRAAPFVDLEDKAPNTGH
jgi:hypothetical protein